MAIACGTVKLTVAVTVMPVRDALFQHVETGGGGRKLHRDVRRPRVKALRHGPHAFAVPSPRRIHLRAHQARPVAGRLERREQFPGGLRDRNLHQRFGFLLRWQVARKRSIDIRAPQLAILRDCCSRQDRIGRDANRPPIQTDLELGRIGRVVPPSGLRVLDDPTEICVLRCSACDVVSQRAVIYRT
jgi:hypothetical protein